MELPAGSRVSVKIRVLSQIVVPAVNWPAPTGMPGKVAAAGVGSSWVWLRVTKNWGSRGFVRSATPGPLGEKVLMRTSKVAPEPSDQATVGLPKMSIFKLGKLE